MKKTFNAGEKIPKARLERREVQYLYNDGMDYNFMDMETYDQLTMTRDQLGDAVKYLKENMNIHILTFQGQVYRCGTAKFRRAGSCGNDSGDQRRYCFRRLEACCTGNRRSGTGALFINVGDKLQIDTRTGNYIKRA